MDVNPAQQNVTFSLSRNSLDPASPDYLILANDLGKRSKWVPIARTHLPGLENRWTITEPECLLEHFLKR
jgi:hypothetical protein